MEPLQKQLGKTASKKTNSPAKPDVNPDPKKWREVVNEPEKVEPARIIVPLPPQ